MEFLEQKNDGNDYYELKKGTKLYRGDDRNIDVNKYKPRFFVKEIEHAKVYGKIIYEFSVKEDLKLLAIDKNITSFYDNAPTNIQTILKENYGYESGNRLSESKKDNALLDYICSKNEYHGYAANEMPTQISHFDPEITICEPGEKLTTAKIISNLSKEDTKMAHANAKLIENEKERKENRKRKNRPDKQSSVSPIKFGNKNLFGDDDDDEPNLKPMSLFDGGKRKTKKYWRDMKPSKKGRKTYKKKFGEKCFLYPKDLKYPICHKKTGKVKCKGLLAAHNRAMLSVRRKLKPKKYSYKQITKKARKLGKKYRCKWVKSKKKNRKN